MVQHKDLPNTDVEYMGGILDLTGNHSGYRFWKATRSLHVNDP